MYFWGGGGRGEGREGRGGGSRLGPGKAQAARRDRLQSLAGPEGGALRGGRRGRGEVGDRCRVQRLRIKNQQKAEGPPPYGGGGAGVRAARRERFGGGVCTRSPSLTCEGHVARQQRKRRESESRCRTKTKAATGAQRKTRERRGARERTAGRPKKKIAEAVRGSARNKRSRNAGPASLSLRATWGGPWSRAPGGSGAVASGLP